MLPLLTSLKRNNWFGREPKSIGLSLAYASTRTFRSASLGCQVQRSFSGVHEPCVSEAQTLTWSLWLSPSFILTSVSTRIANPRSAVRQKELSVACYRGLSWMILQKYIKYKTFSTNLIHFLRAVDIFVSKPLVSSIHYHTQKCLLLQVFFSILYYFCL